MSKLVRQIKEKDIAIGDLVFIYHHEKPTKSGWWRKVLYKNEDIYYALEKPLHKDFNFDIESKICHIEKGLCVMVQDTLSFGIDRKNEYEVMAIVKGLDSILLTNNNYDITMINTDETKNQDIIITARFIELQKWYNDSLCNNNDLKQLALKLI